MSGWMAFLFPVLGCLFATGIVGLGTFFWGVMGLLSFPMPFLVAWVLLGIYGWSSCGHLLRPSSPESLQPVRVFLILIVAMLLVRLPAVFSPSGDEDWDTLSHQLAMSRIWLEQGKITDIEWMPHSYIPATINMLYLWGLKWGGQYGAKMFSWLLGVMAILAVGGLTAYRYGRFSGWWASLGLAAVPVFLWEIGTAYQDVSHGLFAGVGAVLAALYLSEKRREWIALSALCLGFALATKYTGFFVLAAVLLTLIAFSLFEKQASQGIKSALVVLALSLLLVSPWLVRNEILSGNPVFPFYSHLFGGENWSAYNAEAWASEQRQFGVGYGVGDFPAAVLGLAVAPDRYANQGSPYYAVGPLLLIGLAYWLFSGRMRREEGALVLILTFSLMVWFATSQQSRYLASLLIPGLFLVGGAIERSSVKGLIKLAVGLQTAWTLFLFVGFPFTPKESESPQSAYDHFAGHASLINKRLVMQVGAMIGRGGSLEGILADTFSFWDGTFKINEIHAGLLGATARQAETIEPRPIKVALFDEPRGYYLHAEYFWANPNYHTLIPYENIRSPEEFVEALKRLGTTHIYLSLLYLDPGERQALMQLMYQPEGAPPLKEPFRKWIIEAYGKGLVRRVGVFNHYEGPGEWHGMPQSFLFEIVVEGAPPPGWTPPPPE